MNKTLYEILPADRVPVEERDQAERVAAAVRRELQLANQYPLRFFVPSPTLTLASSRWVFLDRPGLQGMVHGAAGPCPEVWLRIGQSAEELANTVAHELRHIWQGYNRYAGICEAVHKIYPNSPDGSRDSMEADATRYAARAVLKLDVPPKEQAQVMVPAAMFYRAAGCW